MRVGAFFSRASRVLGTLTHLHTLTPTHGKQLLPCVACMRKSDRQQLTLVYAYCRRLYFYRHLPSKACIHTVSILPSHAMGFSLASTNSILSSSSSQSPFPRFSRPTRQYERRDSHWTSQTHRPSIHSS